MSRLSDEKYMELARLADSGFDGGPDSDGTMTDSIVGKNAVLRFARAVAEAAVQAEREGQEPVAWHTDYGNGLIQYVTDSKYQKFAPAIQRHYRPYTTPPAAPVPEGYALEQDEHGVDVIHKASQCREAIGNGFPIVYGLLRAMLAAAKDARC